MNIEQQKAMTAALRAEYEGALDDAMGKLHNQFVAFIAGAQIPLPHVALVIDMVKREVLDQAAKTYLGE